MTPNFNATIIRTADRTPRIEYDRHSSLDRVCQPGNIVQARWYSGLDGAPGHFRPLMLMELPGWAGSLVPPPLVIGADLFVYSPSAVLENRARASTHPLCWFLKTSVGSCLGPGNGFRRLCTPARPPSTAANDCVRVLRAEGIALRPELAVWRLRGRPGGFRCARLLPG